MASFTLGQQSKAEVGGSHVRSKRKNAAMLTGGGESQIFVYAYCLEINNAHAESLKPINMKYKWIIKVPRQSKIQGSHSRTRSGGEAEDCEEGAVMAQNLLSLWAWWTADELATAPQGLAPGASEGRTVSPASGLPPRPPHPGPEYAPDPAASASGCTGWRELAGTWS